MTHKHGDDMVEVCNLLPHLVNSGVGSLPVLSLTLKILLVRLHLQQYVQKDRYVHVHISRVGGACLLGNQC